MVTFAKLLIWKNYKYISFEVSLTPVSTDALCFTYSVFDFLHLYFLLRTALLPISLSYL